MFRYLEGSLKQRADFVLQPSTQAKYDGVWRLYVEPALGGMELSRITRDDVRRMVENAKRKSPWQAAEALKLTRMLLNRAVDAGRIGRNPAARIEAPRTDREKIRVLTPPEIAAVLGELPERWRTFVSVGAYSSLRWSELVAVKREDIDLEARTLRVDERCVEVEGRFEWGATKTPGSVRSVDLPSLLVAPLAQHLLRYPPLRSKDGNLEGLVFYGARGGVIRRHVFRKDWAKACTAAGVGHVRPEWLRHTGASLAYAATKDMKGVAARLGHTSTRMVDAVYVELYAENSRGMAEAIDDLARASLGTSETAT